MPNGSIIRAVHSESRPNKVKNHGDPAGANAPGRLLGIGEQEMLEVVATPPHEAVDPRVAKLVLDGHGAGTGGRDQGGTAPSCGLVETEIVRRCVSFGTTDTSHVSDPAPTWITGASPNITSTA